MSNETIEIAPAADDGGALPPSVALCRPHLDEAVAMLVAIMREEHASAASRLRAAIEIVAHANAASDSQAAEGEEPGLEDYLERLGPRAPGEPEDFERRAGELRP